MKKINFFSDDVDIKERIYHYLYNNCLIFMHNICLYSRNPVTSLKLVISKNNKRNNVRSSKKFNIKCNVDYFSDSSNSNSSDGSYMDKFTTNITKKAEDGIYEKIIGRDNELKQLQQVLLKRTKRNPLIVGEAGVGKTALVEELARSMKYDKTLNTDLCDNEIIQLDVLSIMSGTSMRGELEKNITNLLKDIKEQKNVILFIDEIHSLVNNGKNTASSGNGINFFDILKPPLSRGEITVIGATTYEEYCKYFKQDAALERRFQVVDIEEPTPEKTMEMMYYIKNGFEKFHKCMIMDAALKRSIELSNKYLPYRQFPDKAIDLIDEACSKVSIESFKDKRHVKIVDTVDIEDVINMINGINITNMNLSIKEKIEGVEKEIEENVIGQELAVKTVVNTLKRHSCGIHDGKKPICSMLFVGPTGVGKTSLCRLIAKEYYGNDKYLIRFDMSEYMTSFSVSSLIGAPPGYVGYEEGGTLINAVKHNPCSVILFDEIEKAHPEVINILLQILEDGILTDSYKRKYSFKNNIIVMTSNAYNEKNPFGMVLTTSEKELKDNIVTNVKSDLTMYFKPEFLNRIDEMVIFQRLTYDNLKYICDLYIKEAQERVLNRTNNKIQVNITEETYDIILNNIKQLSTLDGARPIKRVIEEFIIDPVTDYLLQNDYESKNNVSYINL